MSMVRVLNVVSMTLLVALASVVPATFAGRYVPGIFSPGIKQIAMAAWITGVATWFIATAITRKEQEAVQEAVRQSSSSSKSSMGIALLFLAVAVGIAVGLHYFGDELLH